MAEYNSKGQQIPDNTPVEVPINLSMPLSVPEQIARGIRLELSRQAQSRGMESFDDADDFDMDDDDLPFSPYEIIDMKPEEVIPSEPPKDQVTSKAESEAIKQKPKADTE